MRKTLRFHLATGDRDFDASRTDIAPDGSIAIYKITVGESKPNLSPGAPHGQVIQEQTIELLAIVGPDGTIRAELVEVESGSEPLELRVPAPALRA